MPHHWPLFAVAALMFPFLAGIASPQALASEASLVGDYVCVVDANTALVYGDDKHYHSVVPALSTDEKTFSINIEREKMSDPAACASLLPYNTFDCYANFKMTIKNGQSYFFWSVEGYQFYSPDNGVIQMHNDTSFIWAEVNAWQFEGSRLRNGRCNRVSR